MSASVSNLLNESDIILLRWSDAPGAPVREATAQLLDTHPLDAIIRSDLRIPEKTRVYLIGKNYTASGVINTCQSEGGYFILTIGITEGGTSDYLTPAFDPGVLNVEQWLTDDAIDQILKDLEIERSARSVSFESSLSNTFSMPFQADPARISHWLIMLYRHTTVTSTGLFQFLSRLCPTVQVHHYSPFEIPIGLTSVSCAG